MAPALSLFVFVRKYIYITQYLPWGRVVLESGSHYLVTLTLNDVVQTGWEHVITLCQPPTYWYYRHILPCPAHFKNL